MKLQETTLIKIFNSTNLYDLEKRVNEFTKDVNVVDIEFQTTQDFNDYNTWNTSVMIRYKKMELVDNKPKKEKKSYESVDDNWPKDYNTIEPC